jgi:hypothetical protein
VSTERDGDLDALWADIVAHWDDPPPADGVDGLDEPAPVRGLDDPAPVREPDSQPAPRGIPATESAPSAADDPIESGWRSYEPPEDDEHWEPPAPAPLPPAHDLGFWAVVGGLVGGPVLVLLTVVFTPDNGSWWGWLGVAMTVVGFVLLVRRGAGPRDEGDHGIRL